MTQGIDHLIINSPFEEPTRHWAYDREAQRFFLKGGRRPAGYVRATPGLDSFDDPGIFIPIELPNQIRDRVQAWREAGWPGVTGTTRRLLQHWTDPETFDQRRFFFCQLEAIETLIWLTEASPAERQGVEVPSDGGAFARLCSKMATGSGKTIVMAMAIAWHVLNKVTDPQDRRFLEARLGRGSGADGEEPPPGTGARGSRQLLRPIRRGARRAPRQTAPGEGPGAELA